MPTEKYKIKVKQFIDHLLGRPNITGEPILIGENLVRNFISNNADTLKVTFQSPRFFPDLQWNDVISIISEDLQIRAWNEVMPLVDAFISTTDFSMLNGLNSNQGLPSDFYKEKLSGFMKLIFTEKNVRYNFNSALNIFKFGIFEKYVDEVFNRRDFLFNELVRVQKTYLDYEDYVIYLKVLLLVRNAVHYKVSLNSTDTGKMSLEEQLQTPEKLIHYIRELAIYWQQHLPMLSRRSLELAFKSNLKSVFTDLEDASSRFLYILNARYHNYKPVKVDRGAESPDKSWFSVARANHGLFGFDKRILDDLYMIAADNFW